MRTIVLRAAPSLGAFFVVCSFAAAAGAQTAVTVNGELQYQGANGTFNSRFVEVEVWEKDGIVSSLLDTVYTGADGKYTANVNATGATPNIFVKVRPISEQDGGQKSQIQVVDYTGPTTDNGLYLWTSAEKNPTGGTVTIDKTFNGGAHLDYAFSVFDAAVTQAHWNDSRDGIANNSVKIRFGGNPSSSFSPTNGWINLVDGDRFDWDVIGEEYNHYMQNQHGYGGSPGGSHSGSANLRWERGPGTMGTTGSADLDFEDANRLAFSEGSAQFFSIAAQIQQNAGALGIVRAGDIWFSDTIDQSFDYSLETVTGSTSLGEDEETAVQRILWDLYDTANESQHRDRIALGLEAIYDLIDDNSLETLTAFWDKLIDGKDIKTKVDYGAIFQSHNVSPVPDDTSIPVGGIDPDTAPPPTFKWTNPLGKRNSADVPTDPDDELMDKFELRFFDKDLTTLLLAVPVFGNTEQHTLTVSQWDTLNDHQGRTRWIVAGGNHGFDTSIDTGLYWSDSSIFRLVPEPGTAVLLALGLGGLGAWRRRAS